MSNPLDYPISIKPVEGGSSRLPVAQVPEGIGDAAQRTGLTNSSTAGIPAAFTTPTTINQTEMDRVRKHLSQLPPTVTTDTVEATGIKLNP